MLDRRDLRLLGVVVAVECLLVLAYLSTTPAEATKPRYTLYPFVWINTGLWAVLRTVPPVATLRQRIGAGLLAALYLFVLMWLSGLVGFVPVVPAEDLLGLSIGMGTPGWERIRLVTPLFYLTFVPFRVIGYLSLAYLVYTTAITATRAVVTGAIGFLSCLSCSVTVLISLASGAFGGTIAFMDPFLAYSLDISTAVFVVAVAALYVQPGFESVGRQSAQRIE